MQYHTYGVIESHTSHPCFQCVSTRELKSPFTPLPHLNPLQHSHDIYIIEILSSPLFAHITQQLQTPTTLVSFSFVPPFSISFLTTTTTPPLRPVSTQTSRLLHIQYHSYILSHIIDPICPDHAQVWLGRFFLSLFLVILISFPSLPLPPPPSKSHLWSNNSNLYLHRAKIPMSSIKHTTNRSITSINLFHLFFPLSLYIPLRTHTWWWPPGDTNMRFCSCDFSPLSSSSRCTVVTEWTCIFSSPSSSHHYLFSIYPPTIQHHFLPHSPHNTHINTVQHTHIPLRYIYYLTSFAVLLARRRTTTTTITSTTTNNNNHLPPFDQQHICQRVVLTEFLPHVVATHIHIT